jgi:hypothetical protein
MNNRQTLQQFRDGAPFISLFLHYFFIPSSLQIQSLIDVAMKEH